MPNSLICERIPGDGNSLITIHDTASAEKNNTDLNASASLCNIGYYKV